MCFGNDQTVKKDTTDLPQWLNDAAKSNVSYASNNQNKGFTSYDNPMVAGFSPQQTSSFGLGNDVAAGAAPAIGNTGNWINDYANGAAGHVTPSSIASRMSPYMNQYVMQALAPSLEAQDQQFAGQNKSFDSASTGAGAFGDSSYNLGRTNLTNQQNTARTGLVADAYQRAFNTAIGAGAQDVSNDVNAQTTNASLNEQALNRRLAGANAGYTMGVGSTNLTNSLGGQQTAADQARLNAQYNEFLRAQYQDPKFRADMMNSAIASGKTGSDVTTTSTAPNNAGYGLIGAGLGAAGYALGGPIGGMVGTGIGSLFGPSGSGDTSTGYADGGRPPVGKPVLVGERGPEVFHPDSAYGGGGRASGWHHGHMDPNGGQPGGSPNWLSHAFGGGLPPGFGLMGANGALPAVGQPAAQPNGMPPALPPGFGLMGGTGLSHMLNPAANGGLAMPQPTGGMPGTESLSPTAPTGAQPGSFNMGMSSAPPTGGAGPKLPGFAEGGDYPVDEPFVVGENGPEVITMDQPGTVIPNEALSGGNNNLEAAHKELNLSPQERALYERHLSNLNGPGGVDNPDGTRSSLFNVGTTVDGKHYNVPSVYDGKILPPKDAYDRAVKDGIDQFPSYGSQDEAEARYQRMHDFMDRDTKAYQEAHPSAAPTSDNTAEPPLFLKSGTAAPPQPPQPAAPQPAARSPMRGTAALGNPRGPSPAQQDMATLQGIADNPGDTVSNFGLTGGIVGNAIKNKSSGEPQPLGSPKPKPETKGVPYPNSSSVFDLLSPNSAAAAESHDPRPVQEIPEPTEKEGKEIARIGGLITAKNAQLEKKIKASKYANPNKDPDVMSIQGSLTSLQADLARVEGPGSPLGARRTAAIDAHKTELSAWNDRQANLITGKTNAELPYAQKYPERQSWIQENMPKVSAGTGLALGLLGKGKMVAPAVKSAVAGGFEGAGTAAWPALQDTEFLPPGGNWKDAAGRLFNGDESSKDFWKRVGAGAITHGGLAVGMSGAGSAVRDLGGQLVEGAKGIRWPKPQAAETPPNSVFAPPTAAPAAAPKAATSMKAKGPPKEYPLDDGGALTVHDHGKGGMRWRLNGKPIEGDEAKALLAQQTAAKAPRTRARPPIQAVQ